MQEPIDVLQRRSVIRCKDVAPNMTTPLRDSTRLMCNAQRVGHFPLIKQCGLNDEPYQFAKTKILPRETKSYR